MAWRDDLQPATFRDVPFLVAAVEGEYGRRLAEHEYPLRDEPWHRDLGRRAKTFAFEAYVLEPDHIGRAKALIEACEKAGSAALVHPWLGNFNVVVTECRVRFSHAAGGMATFSLAFREAGEDIYPAALKKDAGIVERAADIAKEAISGRLLDTFSLDGVASWVADAATEVFGDALADIGATLSPVIDDASAWARDIRGAVATVSTIVRDPAALASRVFGLLDIGNLSGLASIVQTPLAIVNAVETFTRPGAFSLTWQTFLPLTSFGLGGSSSYTGRSSSARRAAANAAALGSFIRRASAVSMARTAMRQSYATSNDATTAAEAVATVMDRELDTAGDDDGQALQSLAVSTQRAITARLPSLPRTVVVNSSPDVPSVGRVIGYSSSATLPALVIAYSVYGDRIGDVVARADQIVTRNRIAHPGFVLGGAPLELLAIG